MNVSRSPRSRWLALSCAAVAASTAIAVPAAPASGAPRAHSRLSRLLAQLTGTSAVVARTTYGIPHITASTTTGLGYGFGYAFAQDDICTFADDIVTLRAQRSADFGPDGSYDNVVGGSSVNNLLSDYYYQDVNDSGVIEAELAKPSPHGPSQEARQLVAGYAAGYNAYLAATGVNNIPDSRCRGAAWVTPITALDVWRRLYQVSDLEGTSALIPLVSTAQPPTAAAAGRQPSHSRVRSALADAMRKAGVSAAGEHIGSNGFALGRTATPNQTGTVLANPHFPWSGVNRFYQAQLTQPGQLDVSGATLFGVPAIFIGHNQTLAWTHTVSAGYHVSAYIRFTAADPTTYVVDGSTKTMTSRQVTVRVRNADGSLSPSSHRFYSTTDGLVAGWIPGAVEAVADPNAGNLRWLDTELAIGHAASVAQLKTAVATWQGLPFVNTLAADSTGQAYYGDLSQVLHLTNDQLYAGHCLGGVQQGVEVVIGASSTCDPGRDPDAVQTGNFGPAASPSQTRTDYEENSNDSYWLSNASAPLTGYSDQFGPVATARGLRTRQALTQVRHALGAGSTIDQHRLEDIDLNDLNYSAQQDRDAVVRLCQAHPSVTVDGTDVDLRQTCQVLSSWDLKAATSSIGEVVWRQFWVDLELDGGGIPYRVAFDPGDPVNTPNTLDTDNPVVLQELGRAVADLRRANIPLTATWGSLQGTPDGHGGRIPVPGSTGDEGVLNVVGNVFANPLTPPPNRLPDPDFGSSYIMSTTFAGTGPQTNELLAYSESDNPASAHFADQASLFSRGALSRQAYTTTEIATDPNLHITVLVGITSAATR